MIPSQDSRGDRMKRFVEGVDRDQATLFPECPEDWVEEDNPVRVAECRMANFDPTRTSGDLKAKRR